MRYAQIWNEEHSKAPKFHIYEMAVMQDISYHITQARHHKHIWRLKQKHSYWWRNLITKESDL